MKLSLFSLIAATLAPSAIASGLPWKGLLPPPALAEEATPAQQARYYQDHGKNNAPAANHHGATPYAHPGANPARAYYQQPLNQGHQAPAPHLQPSRHHPPQDQHRGHQAPAPHHQPSQHPPQDQHPLYRGHQAPAPHLQPSRRHPPQDRQPPVPPQHNPPLAHYQHQWQLPQPYNIRQRFIPPKIPDPEPGQASYGREHARRVIEDAIGTNLQAIAHSRVKTEEWRPTKSVKAREWENTRDKRIQEGKWLSETHNSLEPQNQSQKVLFIDEIAKALRFKEAASKTLNEQ